MDSDSEIIERACASIHAGASKLSAWARDMLEAVVPIVTQASLTREESNYIQFSLAVVSVAAEFGWDGYLFDGGIECTPANLIRAVSERIYRTLSLLGCAHGHGTCSRGGHDEAVPP